MELFLGLVERLLRSPIYVQRAFLAFTVAMFASCAARVSQAMPASHGPVHRSATVAR
jgi:hypothetical protein